MISNWLNFGEILSILFFILGMVGPIDVKLKGNESTGCYAD